MFKSLDYHGVVKWVLLQSTTQTYKLPYVKPVRYYLLTSKNHVIIYILKYRLHAETREKLLIR